MLAWVDVETTGLDPQRDALLEVALVFTTNDLEETSYCERVVHHASLPPMSDVVREMHTRNGLIDVLEEHGKICSHAEDDLVGFVSAIASAAMADGTAKQIPLCGSMVAFDRAFLREWMPRLEGMFHYRSVDVSSLKELVRRWAPAVYVGRPQATEKAHRALADVRESIAELRWYREQMKWGF